MIYLLAPAQDESAMRFAAALQRRGEPCEWVLPEELLLGSTLACRIDGSEVSSSLRLRDGRVLSSRAAALVLNRLTELPTLHASCAMDAAYLAEEWRAVLVAWLRTLHCPVLNPPRGSTLGGPVLSQHVWRSIARAHGLPVSSEQAVGSEALGQAVTLTWVIRHCLDPTGAAPSSLVNRIAGLARFMGTPLLGLTFDRRGEEWCLVTVDPMPSLDPTVVGLIDALIVQANQLCA